MPSGYTAPIKDGITFEQYALGCARAFGALITLRDEPSSTPIPDAIEPSDYYQRGIDESHSKLAELELMSDSDCDVASERSHREAREYTLKLIAENSDLEDKYKAMLAKCQAYVPPSPDHENFKKFLCDQIQESIKFDCGSGYYEEQLNSPALTGEQWRKEQIQACRESIERQTRLYKEEVDRCAERSLWIRQLKASLNGGAK